MSVLTREKKTQVRRDAINVTTAINPVVPGAVTVSGTLEPQGAVSTTPLPRAGAISHTALPSFGAVNITIPTGHVEKLTEGSGKDGIPV